MNLSILDACTQKKRIFCRFAGIRVWSWERVVATGPHPVRSRVRMSVQVPPPAWFAPALAALLERRHLNGIQMCEIMHGLLSGACGDVETAALLVALSMKGETAEELAAAAAVVREHLGALDLGRTDVPPTPGT